MASWRADVQGLARGTRGTLGGFKAFILRGNVVDLAVGIMIGAAFSGVVNALVTDVITPLIPAGKGSLAGLQIPTYTHRPILLGTFIEAVISFLILAFVIYFFIVKPVNALMAHYKPKEVEAPPATRDCPYCLSSVPLHATRCAYCTSPLPPPGQVAQPIPPAQQ